MLAKTKIGRINRHSVVLTDTRSCSQLLAGLVVVALMAFSLPMVYADNGVGDGKSDHQGGDWHHAQQAHRTAQILGLTSDQEKQLKDLHQKKKEAMKSVFEQIKSNRAAFEAEIMKAAPDMNKINDLQGQLKTIQAQMVDNHLNSILETKKIMSPEQFAGYMALEKEEDLMKHEGRKNGFGKDGNEHRHWGDKSDKDHGPDDQD